MFFALTMLGETDYNYAALELEDFFGWSLSSIEDYPTIYQFDLENQSSDIKVEDDYKLYKTYQQYPSYKFGNSLYKTGNFKTIPYTYSHVTKLFTTDVALLNNLISFINNKQEKILTTASNESFRVVTNGAKYKYYDKIPEQPYTLSFDFIQTSA